MGQKPRSRACTAQDSVGDFVQEGGEYMNICPVLVVLVFVVLDIVTGLAKAFATSGFDSSIMRQGFWHKLGELLAVALTLAVDYGAPEIGLPINAHLTGICCTYLVLMEIGSVLENIGKINPDLVGPLNKIFAKLRGDNDGTE